MMHTQEISTTVMQIRVFYHEVCQVKYFNENHVLQAHLSFYFSVYFTIIIKVESNCYDNLMKVHVNWPEISWSEN